MALQRFADKLIQNRHHAAAQVAEQRAGVLSRWSKLKSSLASWRSTLAQSRCLQQFMREAGEAEAWLAEKMQTASDESYKDPTNLSVRV